MEEYIEHLRGRVANTRLLFQWHEDYDEIHDSLNDIEDSLSDVTYENHNELFWDALNLAHNTHGSITEAEEIEELN